MKSLAKVSLLAVGVVLAVQFPSFAHVMPVGSASFEVSVQVVASCDVDTGSAPGAMSCNGVAAGRVDDVPASALSDPTQGELAASADTRAVSVVY